MKQKKGKRPQPEALRKWREAKWAKQEAGWRAVLEWARKTGLYKDQTRGTDTK